VLALVVEFVVVIVVYWLGDFPFALAGAGVWPVMLGLAAVKLLSLTVYLIIGLTLIRAVLSWVNSDTPLVPVVYTLTEPFLHPLRRVVPMISNIDLTPLVLFILCQLVLMVPLLALERALLGSL
jgi:YggT family protein